MFELKGKWFNTKTNKTVYPKECLQEDGRMYVLFMDGQRMLMEDFQNSFIQVSDEIYDPNMNVVSKQEHIISEIVDDESNDILSRPIVSTKEFEMDEDDIRTIKGLGNISKNNTNIKNPASFDIINKAFEKQGYKYEYEFKSKSVYPKKIHEFLKDFTDVKDDEIVDYIINTFLDYDSIRKAAVIEVKRLFNIQDKDDKTPDVDE